ncbi:hypothetical protein E2C01_013081 [Portunus trituberculatus]|uniref:Uncharacterized protein n=1 Tax=Portunus trituberculatus TaxID=210409 RepID=A0A5B7DFQ2_PORTR|nr:hypothetical protein [Portunus trituberculatus]
MWKRNLALSSPHIKPRHSLQTLLTKVVVWLTGGLAMCTLALPHISCLACLTSPSRGSGDTVTQEEQRAGVSHGPAGAHGW